jgi:hypothetical protein
MRLLILRSDYCLHDEVPETIESGLHNLEGICEDCSITRKSDFINLPDCPVVSCDDGSGDSAFQNMLSVGCDSFCGADECGEHYRILRAVHDTCPEDSLSTSAEQGLHDFEDPCVAYDCNPKSLSDLSELVCSTSQSHDTSPASSEQGSSAAEAIWGHVQHLTLIVTVLVAAHLVEF